RARQRGVDHRAGTGPDLRRGTQGVYQVLEPAQQRIRVLLLRAYVDLLCTEATPHGNGSKKSVWRRCAEAGVGRVVPLHRRSARLTPVKAQVLTHPDLLAVPQRRRARQREL